MKIGFAVLWAAVFVLCFNSGSYAEDAAEEKFEAAKGYIQGAVKDRLGSEISGLEARRKYEMALSNLNEIRMNSRDWRSDEIAAMTDECEKAIAGLKGLRPEGGSSATVRTPSCAISAGAEPPAQALVGNRQRKKLHRSECGLGRKIPETNRIYFESYREAVDAGYSPCKVCNPNLMAGAPATRVSETRKQTSSCPLAQTGPSLGREAKAAVAPKPNAENPPSGGKYLSTPTSKYFHSPDCDWAKTISSQNLITYGSSEEAVKAGKKPCQVCKP